MLKRVNGRPVPNNPAKAYELGRLDGTKQCMDNVSCVLLDKLGFHVMEETADEHDTVSCVLWTDRGKQIEREKGEGEEGIIGGMRVWDVGEGENGVVG